MTTCCPVAGVALPGNESFGCHSKGDIKEEIEWTLFKEDKYMLSYKLILHMVLKVLVVVSRYVQVKIFLKQVKTDKTCKNR